MLSRVRSPSTINYKGDSSPEAVDEAAGKARPLILYNTARTPRDESAWEINAMGWRKNVLGSVATFQVKFLVKALNGFHSGP